MYVDGVDDIINQLNEKAKEFCNLNSLPQIIILLRNNGKTDSEIVEWLLSAK